MDRMIYLSMTGAKATIQRQDVISNNLANVSTTGFRAEMAAFRAVPVRGDGASTRVPALETTTGYDATPGPMQNTGRNLDVAMVGNAWLAVQGLDGTEAYTRAGSLDLDAQGQVVTRTGLPVMGEGGPISVPAGAGGTLSIGSDGTVSITGADGRTEWPKGYSCIAEKRAIETIQDGKPSTEFMRFGDTIRIEAKGKDGQSLFGAIEQKVVGPGAGA